MVSKVGVVTSGLYTSFVLYSCAVLYVLACSERSLLHKGELIQSRAKAATNSQVVQSNFVYTANARPI